MGNILVIVHPGSTFGSAAMNIGKSQAEALRYDLIDEIQNHSGGLIVIDGSLSDEIRGDLKNALEDALKIAKEAGHISLRLWGCDSGERPYSRWISENNDPRLIFDSQMDAASYFMQMLIQKDDLPNSLILTGAWASDSDDSGCVNSVRDTLLPLRVSGVIVEISETAFRLPEEYLSNDLDEDCDP